MKPKRKPKVQIIGSNERTVVEFIPLTPPSRSLAELLEFAQRETERLLTEYILTGDIFITAEKGDVEILQRELEKMDKSWGEQ